MTLKMEALQAFKTSAITHLIQCHIPKDLNPSM